MRAHRFFGAFELRPGSLWIRDRETVNQAKNVLRLKIGDPLVLLDGNGKEAEAVVLRFGKDGLEAGIREVRPAAGEPARRIHLYCAILKKENFEWVAEKAAETGAFRIVPVVSERTVKLNLNLPRLAKILKEAAEQSGRGIVPALVEPVSFSEALALAAAHERNFFLDPRAKTAIPKKDFREAGIFIGPEGGWSEREEGAVRSLKNFQAVGLGELVLRAETAAIIGTYLAARGFLRDL